MADSVNPYAIPAGQFPLVAGYVDGLYAWSGAGWKYHDQSLHVRISAIPYNYDADVCDMETFDYTPAQAAQFVRFNVDRGRWVVAYFSTSRFGEVHAAMLARGVQDNQWGIWGADWNNRPFEESGQIATQFADGRMLGTGYDESAVSDYWPGIDPLPQPVATGGAAGAVQSWQRLQQLVGSDLGSYAGGHLGLQSFLDSLG